MKHPTFVLLTVLVFGVTTSITFQSSFAQMDVNRDLAVVSINKYVDGIPTGTVYIFDQNYSLIKILDSPEEPTLGQFSGDITYKDDKLILSTSSRENEHTPIPSGPLSRVGAISIFDGTTGSLIKTIWNPESNTVKDYVGGTFGASITYIGDSIVVGNPNHDINGMRGAGAVHVFDDAGNLLLTIKNPNPNESANFGGALASWNDKIVVGISGRAVANSAYAGAVSIYDANTGSLLKTMENPNPTPYARFGSSLDVSGDNLLIAAPVTVIDNEENVGEVYLYDANTGNLVKTIKNPDPDEGDHFGRTVMFAGDKIVIGATGDGVSDEGSVYIYDKSGTLLNTIHSPDKTAKEGLYSNEFGVSLAFSGNRLAIGDDNKMTNGIRAGGVYIFDITNWDLLQTIDNPVPETSDAFGYFLEFVGDMEPSQEIISKINEEQEPAQTETTQTKQGSDTEEWVEPKRDTVSVFSGTLAYDKIPSDFKCDISPRMNYQYVDKSIHPQYPDNDSLFVRIGGEDTIQDFEIVFSLWREQDSAYAQDLSYHITLKNQDGSDVMGAIYSPDAYSDYSTLGVMVEANGKASKDGAVPSDVEKKFVELFGHSYVLPVLMQPNGNYELYVRVFDSENDWIRADTCGIQAIIPISANGEDSVTVGKIQFSDVLVSATETDYENLETTKKIIDEAVAKKNAPAESDQNSESNVADDARTEYLSPLRQFNAGAQIDKITCRQGLELIFKNSDNSPSCVRPETKLKLAERGWTKPKQISTEISAETRLNLVGFLEGGQVSEFNSLRKDIVGFLLLEGVTASGLDLSGINLENVCLPQADLHDTILDDAKLHKAKLLKANLQHANLENLDLSGASLENADLKYANLKGTNLEDAWLVGADLTGANLHGAYMKSANLRHAILQDADLRDVDLQGASLDGANLQNADLEDANLEEAFFYNTNLEGVKNFPIPIEKAKAGGIIMDSPESN